ncbi:MAG: formylglycine-generating enzyme family protein [Thermodesulfobacteriota bacterium]|nr:formylglycine-generating enzyme family protein [Thermodesulfobacteriota bacterium]
MSLEEKKKTKQGRSLYYICLVSLIALCLITVASCGGKGVKRRARYFTGNTFTNSIGMKFVLIPQGSFMMGSPADEAGRGENENIHKVEIEKPFYMQTREVTQEQWKKVMGKNPTKFKHCGSDCPVDNVSWNDVKTFIRKLNRKEKTNKYRIPTEAEWEYACRAGTTTIFYTGDCISTAQANYNGNYPLGKCPEGEYRYAPVAVGSFAPNPWGLYDMHGNVWEWCQDWDKDYEGDPAAGLKEYRSRRGGSWRDTAQYVRSASRLRVYPKYKYKYSGFRIAADPASKK